MAAKAKDGGGEPAQIVTEALAAIPEDAKTEMRYIDSAKQWIWKASKSKVPSEPGSAAALSMPDNYIHTLLQYNNGPECEWEVAEIQRKLSPLQGCAFRLVR